MQYFERFQFAIPAAFAEALSLCCFEKGDVLYRAKRAYSDWNRWIKDAKAPKATPAIMLQIIEPDRDVALVAGKKGASDSDSNFLTQWQQTVKLDCYDFEQQTQTDYQTTQGGLLMYLWQGDICYLKNEGEIKDIPYLLSSLSVKSANQKQRLWGLLAYLRKRYRLAQRDGEANSVFLCAVDQASSMGDSRFSALLTCIEELYGSCRLRTVPEFDKLWQLAPKAEAEALSTPRTHPQPSNIHPRIQLSAYRATKTYTQITSELKEALTQADPSVELIDSEPLIKNHLFFGCPL